MKRSSSKKMLDWSKTIENDEIALKIRKSLMEKVEEDELAMLRKIKDENKKLNNEVEALKDRLLRLTAEYENYRKRTTKEKEGIYTDACTDVLKEIFQYVDNLERALAVEGNVEDIKKGVEMTIKGLKVLLKN